MNEHTTDCRIHDDGSCCDCGLIAQEDHDNTEEPEQPRSDS